MQPVSMMETAQRVGALEAEVARLQHLLNTLLSAVDPAVRERVEAEMEEYDR